MQEFEGRRRVGHSGAIYGFSTDLSALPDDKLGVVVVSSLDCSNAVTTHIADEALRHLLAVKQKKPLPKIAETAKLKPERAKELAGRYKAKNKVLDLTEFNGHLYVLPVAGGFRQELRCIGDDLIVDDRIAYGQRIQVKDGKLHVGADVYDRVATTKPPPMPAKWAGLIGEYGWDHNTLYIFEKDGQLYALIEWFFVYPLKEESENVYAFPDFGLYLGEKLVFTRDKNGRATQVEAAKRRVRAPQDRRRKRRDVHDQAAAARRGVAQGCPRRQTARRERRLPRARSRRSGETRRHDQTRHPLRDDEQLPQARRSTRRRRRTCRSRRRRRVVRVHKKLKEQGYGLMVHDAYRPWAVTKMFWDATPQKQHIFVADPSKGSRHNRGCAVDLTLYDLKTGKPVEMVGGYDEMSDRSYPEYLGGTSLQRWHRELLRHAMESEGFTVYEAEWWHFDYKDWRKYGI